MEPKNGTLYYNGYSGLTAAAIASQLGRTLSSSESTFLTKTISAIETTLARLCNRNFNTQYTYREIFDTGCDTYIVRNIPIDNIKKIIVSGETKYEAGENDAIWTQDQDFFVYDHEVIFNLPIHSYPKRRALIIEYTIQKFWGNDVPSAISQWCIDLLTTREYSGREVKKFTFTTLSVEFQPTMSEDKLPPYVREVINTYNILPI